MLQARKWLAVAGGVGGALAIVAGAVGAHALDLEPGTQGAHQYDTAVNYLLLHAIVVMLGHWCQPARRWLWDLARAAMLVGMVLFSGGLLLMIATGWRVPVIPAGGMSLIAGWLMAAVAVAQSTQEGGRRAAGKDQT